VKPGNVNDVTYFRSTILQFQKKLTEGFLIIFDKGAGSKQNLKLIDACKHEYLTAKKLNKSDDKIIETFWERNPIRINPGEKEPNQGIYGIKIVKPSSVTYFYLSEGLEVQGLDAISRKVYRQFMEAEMIPECISRKKKLPKKLGISNPQVKIAYSVQIKLVQMSDDAGYHEGAVLAEQIFDLRPRLNTGRWDFSC